ncbi:hypothetical protein N7486_005627 [Penicillium sp. IBT 16267x]|nr:hypothetical protein N7486_005627 [Penicillium sp. IBT 16267x]
MRTSQACDQCRRRKIRCSGQPNCPQCTHVGLTCTYAVATQDRSRNNAVTRGKIIVDCRQLGRPSTPSTPSLSIARSINSHPNPAFFFELLPQYNAFVYPMNPVIEESEIRSLVSQMGERRDAAAFTYGYAAVTLYLTQRDSAERAPAEWERISSILTKCLEYHNVLGLDSQPSIVHFMTDMFLEICLIGLRRPELGLLYLRRAISILYLLKVDSVDAMNSLDARERARYYRAYWECFMHERFTSLTCYKPTCLLPLRDLPEHDPSIPRHVEDGFNRIIENFLLVDRDFVDFWLGDRSTIAIGWIEQKQKQLEDAEWHRRVAELPLIQQADLIVTRHWLRTLTWQIALSNFLLSSSAPSPLLSLSFPLKLSNDLQTFLADLPRDILGIHGLGILEKLLEITITIADVVLHLDSEFWEGTVSRIEDIHFLQTLPGFQDLQSSILTAKLEAIRQKYPEVREMELLG